MTTLQRRIQKFGEPLRDEFQLKKSQGVCWLDAVENHTVEVRDAVSAALLAKLVKGRPDPADESTRPVCGQTGRSRSPQKREWISRRGRR